ncbi:SDR family oxidoreductase [Gordonia sp. (in: high G+C Gram-positive bacteria)]|uniref:SDR family NAD(P)-dependent oxidoreductase n=1 Tax=Gordonia sp. (in: high G+C Gram-positive bacteria) TaxID=84139 RepID=UPI0016ADD6EF|nr:SDR family oxidoreductase [Gordonia sp. (in: high G+C Gram-positive bacteria)]NLG47684.1 SDR family oxidoreductase [Gordonia sp. (in: high G+C Gram-positive bacteria)]
MESAHQHLAGKTAIITGAGQGIGQGIALAMADAGARVAAVGRTESKLESTREQIEAEGGVCATFVCDVKDADGITATVDAVAEKFGRIDILVNNAQQVPLGTLMAVSDDRFQKGFSSGPLATFRFMKACHPHLQASGDAVILNLTSSTTKRWDMGGYGPYAAVKSAIVSLTRAAAAEWGVDGIRALAIAPHAESAGLNWWIEANPEEAAAFFQTIPLRRIGDCRDDIGVAVAALCGPEFRYLTGATIPLDGGQAYFS